MARCGPFRMSSSVTWEFLFWGLLEASVAVGAPGSCFSVP